MRIDELFKDKEYNVLRSYIQKNCSASLRFYKLTNKFLFHGFSNLNLKSSFVAATKENRMPKGSNLKLQIRLDKILIRDGFKAVRSNCLFCTSDSDQALFYGEVYYIFPLNGFEYTWNKNEKDLVLKSEFQLGNDTNYSLKGLEDKFRPLCKNYARLFKDKDVGISNDLYYCYLMTHDIMNKKIDTNVFVSELNDVVKKIIKYNKKSENKINIKSLIQILQDFQNQVSRHKITKDHVSAFDMGYLNNNLDKCLISEHEVYVTGMFLALKKKNTKILLKL